MIFCPDEKGAANVHVTSPKRTLHSGEKEKAAWSA
jgi:hypothetical protein